MMNRSCTHAHIAIHLERKKLFMKNQNEYKKVSDESAHRMSAT